MSEFILNAFADESSGELAGQIDALKRNGLSGLEIRGIDGQNVGEITLDKAKEIKTRLDAEGLNTWSIGSRLGKIGIDEDPTAHYEEFKHTIEVARILDAKYIRMFSFFMPKDADYSDYTDEVMARLTKFTEMAKGSGVKLCHENEKGIYGDIAPRCLEIAKAFPDMGVIFDPANYVQCGQDTLEAWEMLKDRVTYMHIKDALSDGSVVPAGKGEGNVKFILGEYKKLGGIGLTLEPHLKVFSGLKDLEQEGDTSVVGEKFEYPTNEAAFDAAVAALKEII